MSRARSISWVRLLAFAVAAIAVLVPVGRLVHASLRVTEVTLQGGVVVRAAGAVVTDGDTVRFQAAPRDDPDGELVSVSRPRAEVVSVEDRWSLAHYADVLGSARTPSLLVHSLELAGGAALLALLLGIPVGWALARTEFAGRRLLGVLLAAPLLLPPFFAAMGVSTSVGAALAALGLTGGTLQLASGAVCLAGLFAPVPALLVGRALAAVPAGLVEAATLAGGARAARRAVVVPAVRPAVVASFVLVFVVALTDFAVPDLLGVFLPKGAVPVHVFATEIFLQWSKLGNVGRAVATGVPFAAAVLVLVALAVVALRRSPAGLRSGAARPRPRRPMRGAAALVPWAVATPVLALGVLLPLGAVASWGFHPLRVAATVRATVGLVDDTTRWLRLGLSAALVSTAVAVVLARATLRGPRVWRAATAATGALPLAVPGMAFGVAVLLAYLAFPVAPGTLWKGVIVLVGRTLPYTLAACVLALREADPRLEEPARLLGARPATVAARVWGPMAWRGVVSAFLLALVVAWRELDALVLVEPGILPIRIYDKVHFGRTADVANLSMGYLGLLLLPAGGIALLHRRRGRADGAGAA